MNALSRRNLLGGIGALATAGSATALPLPAAAAALPPLRIRDHLLLDLAREWREIEDALNAYPDDIPDDDPLSYRQADLVPGMSAVVARSPEGLLAKVGVLKKGMGPPSDDYEELLFSLFDDIERMARMAVIETGGVA